jgi:hypothetical protein
MSGKIVDSILQQINRSPDAARIKKLLFYRLEIELNASRCEIGPFEKQPEKEYGDLKPGDR